MADSGAQEPSSASELREELKRLRELVAQREGWFGALLELSSDLVVVLDARGVVQYESPSFHRLLGLQPEERRGVSFLERVHPEDQGRVSQAFANCLAEPSQLQKAEVRIAHVDGRWRTVDCVARNLLADPAVGGVVVNLREITERKWAQSALRVIMQAVEQSPATIVITDPKGCIEFVNPAFTEITGYTLDEALGENPRILKSGLMPPEVFRELWATILSGKVWRGEMQNRAKDGRIYWEFASIGPVIDEEGQITHFVAVKEDITARREAQDALQRSALEMEWKNWELAEARDLALTASRLKSEFLANLSHEVRTPMNAVLGMAALLGKTRLEDTQRAYLETIQQSGELLLRLLNQLLDFSKLEAGRLELDLEPFDPRTLLEDTVALFTGLAARKSLDLICDLDPKLPGQLHGDALRLRQVAANLLGNALKFTESGAVVLRLRSESVEGNRVKLLMEVEDTGIGIAPEVQERIFHAFMQADGTTTRRFGGTGLGLSISRQLVELMGGHLSVQSQPGQGSCFSVHLELEVLGEAPAPRGSLRQRRALLWLPEGWVRQALGHLCEGLGLAVGHGEPGCEVPPGTWDFCLGSAEGGRVPGAGARLLLLKPGEAPPELCESCRGYLRMPFQRGQVIEALEGILGGQTQAPPERDSNALPGLPEVSREAPAILIVDDHEVNLQLMEALLRDIGCYTEVARGGREALERLASRQYQLVLLDCQMPDMDGFEVVARLRSREGSGRRTPVAAFTASALEGDRERCRVAGMDDHLPKPVSLEALESLVTRWTGWRRPGAIERVTPLAAAPEAPLDLACLEPLRHLKGSQGKPLVQELVQLFLRDLEPRLSTLRQAWQDAAPEAMGRAAHALKGPSASLGARLFSAQCLELERLGRSGSLEGAEALIRQLEAEAQRVAEALRGLSEG